MKTIMPLYTWEGFTAIYAARVAQLKPGDIAVVNGANNGPGDFRTELMAAHITGMQAKNVIVMGYVHVSHGERTMDDVLDDIVCWRLWYGVTRVFVDEWPEDWGSAYIGSVWGAVRGYSGRGTLDDPILCVNPGRWIEQTLDPPAGTLVVTHEGTTYPPSLGEPAPWEAVILREQVEPVVTRWHLAKDGWAWGFVTSDGADGNGYDGLSL